MRRWLGPALTALAAQSAATCWLTWPLAAFAATHLPMRFRTPAPDSLLLGWALAHESRALVGRWWTLPHAPAFHPTTHALFYGEAGFGALPFFAPVFLTSGNPTLALNVTLLGGVALTATSLHLVIRRLTGSWLAGLVGGFLFLTTHWVLWSWIVLAPNYAVLLYLPPIMLLAAEGLGSIARTLGFAALLALQGLTSVYVAAAIMLPVGILALIELMRRGQRREGLRLLGALALAALALTVAYSGYLTVREANPKLQQQTIYGLVRLGRISLPWGPFRDGMPMAIPSAAFALIAAGIICQLAWRRPSGDVPLGRAWAHGALWVVVGLVFSLTPLATWDGQRIVLPHFWIGQRLPIYDVLREPPRLAVAGLMGFAVLAGAGFAACARVLAAVRLPSVRRALAAGLAALALWGLYATYARGFTIPVFAVFTPLPGRFPLTMAPTLPSWLGAALEDHPGPLLELPVGVSALRHAEAMYVSIFHRRLLINGYNGYWPVTFPMRMHFACRLPDPAALAELRRMTGLETILVRLVALDQMTELPPPYGCPADAPRSAAWREVIAGTRTDLHLVARDGYTALFAVTP